MIYILTHLIVIYGITYMTFALHELGHCIAALMIKAKINKIVLGSEWKSLKIWNCYISPLLSTFYVEINLRKRDKYEGLIYYMGGAFINLVLICISLNVKNNILVSTFILLLNVFCFLNSVLPLGDKSDIKLWYKLYENN